MRYNLPPSTVVVMLYQRCTTYRIGTVKRSRSRGQRIICLVNALAQLAGSDRNIRLGEYVNFTQYNTVISFQIHIVIRQSQEVPMYEHNLEIAALEDRILFWPSGRIFSCFGI